MKRTMALLLVVVLLCFTACSGGETTSTEPSADNVTSGTVFPSSSSMATTKTTVKPTTTAPLIAPNYRAMTCRASASVTWKTVRIRKIATSTDLRVDIPSDWKLTAKGQNTYTVSRGGKAIGYITTAPLPTAQEMLDTTTLSGDLQKICQVNWYRENGQNTVYRTFRFVNMQDGAPAFMMFWNIDYTELDDAAAERLATSLAKNYNTDLVHPSQGNGSKKIAILGNSFVHHSFSGIGVLLEDMLTQGNKDYTVEVVCKGGQGLQAFSSDEALLNRIRSGEFCYVFQCGYYSAEAARKLSVIQQACDDSDTKLVIFPAHNEQMPHIIEARLGHDRAYYLDWKSEVQSFIDNGANRWLFCYDDAHQHSTLLAGYVGAHMIYRSLFKEVPPALTDFVPLPMEHVRSILGSAYVDHLPPAPTYSETYTIV